MGCDSGGAGTIREAGEVVAAPQESGGLAPAKCTSVTVGRDRLRRRARHLLDLASEPPCDDFLLAVGDYISYLIGRSVSAEGQIVEFVLDGDVAVVSDDKAGKRYVAVERIAAAALRKRRSTN
jgi:hypothetical protein